MVISLVDLWICIPLFLHVWTVPFVVTFVIAIVALDLTLLVFIFI